MSIKLAVFIVLMYSGYCEGVNKTESYSCSNNADCNRKNQKGIESCSVCADSIDGKAQCLFPFPYMFLADGTSCRNLNTCNLDCTAMRGQCFYTSVVYTPSCSCKDRYYGPNCQYKALSHQKETYYVSWNFKGFIPVNEVTELKFVFITRHVRNYMDTQLVMNTSDGYYVKQTGFNEVQGNCVYGSINCTALHLKIKFPYKLYSRTGNTQFITLKDNIVGYFANFSIMASDLGKIIYNRQYQIIVSYEQKVLKCVASIKIRNCARSPEASTIFNRPTLIDIVSELFYVTDGRYVSTSVANKNCLDSNTITWKLWRFTGDKETEPLFENYMNQKAWSFKPYSLDLGMYKVLFTVQNVKSHTSNFAYCYIKVKALPLVVRVEGGSDRMIHKNYGLALSAARSTDPNMPPSKQQDLFVEWSCKRISPPTDFDPVCKSITMNAATPYIVPQNLLMYSAVYNFTAKLWSKLYINCGNCGVKPKLAFIRIEVGNETSDNSISIQCVQNCKDKVIPNEPLLLKVTSDNLDVSLITRFEWTYSNASITDNSLNNMEIEGMPPFMLLLKEGSLESGTAYTVTVKEYSEGAYAKYSFETDSLSYDEVCKVEPLNGVRGLTEFDIICPLKDDYAVIFEFYDKSLEDTTSNLSFNGRMLGTTRTGQLQNIRLTRGYVTVYIINSQGAFIKQEIIVQLSEWNYTTQAINELKKNLTDSLIHFGDELDVLRLSSLITDILPYKENRDYKFLLASLSEISLDTFAQIKIMSSNLHIVIRSFNTPIQFKLQTDILVNALDFVDKLAIGFRQSVFNRQSSEYTLTKVIKEIAEINLQSFSLLTKCKINKTVDIELDEITLTDETRLKYGSYIIDNIINNLKDVLTFIQYPGKPPVQISTQNEDMKIWAITNDKHYPISRYLNNNYSIPVSISVGLMNSLINKTYKDTHLSLQTAYIGDSHFKWYTSDIKSSLVSVSLATRKGERDLTYIKSLQQPITIHMVMDDNLMNIKLEGSITQADPSLHQDYLDMQVNIHRLDIRPRSRMTIIFLYPPTNGSLRVSVMEEYRPDFDHMIKNSIIISKESIEYPHLYHEYDEPRFLYMGIIPGKEVSVNQSVSYIFEVNTTLCQYWFGTSWKSDGCLVGQASREKTVSCQCTHLSTFGTAFLVPPQQVDPFGDAKLFLTVLDNPLVVSLVAAFLIFYLLLCIYLWSLDKKDELRKNVIVLEDNLPYDEYAYLLAVFTSPRLNAGTTANVGVRLVGSEAESRAHILKSSFRKVLKTGSDDWFLIVCSGYLGKILHLHLWHDNAGWSPSWFCEKIFVYDLSNHTETTFVVEQWLALRSLENEKEKDVCFPEARVLPSEVEDISSVKIKFLDNVVLGIRDGHTLLRVLYRHPRSQVTSVQRFSIIMLYIMVAMLCSIMFYKPTDETTTGVDDYQYSVGTKEFIISIQCLILSTSITCIVLLSFKRSMTYKTHNRKISSSSSRYSRNKDTLYSSFVRFISTIMKNPPLNPVQLPNTPRNVRVRWKWYIFAWVSCIIIILVCSYLVMLYGLKLGPVKSKKWLTSVFLSVGEDALVIGPAKIVLFAIGLSLAFQMVIDVNTYKISIDDLINQRNVWKNTDVQKILEKRKHKMYHPLSIESRKQILRENQIWSDCWIVLDFVSAVAFVIITCNVIWSSYYFINDHIHDMIADTTYPLLNSIRFYKVSNVTTFENYLGNTFLNAIYRLRWYDGHLINESSLVEYNHWTSDFTNKLVGRPKIRQLRTKAVPCDNIVIPQGLCIPEWEESTEDTNMYSKGWNPASFYDVLKNDSSWIYKEKSSIIVPTLLRFSGQSGRLFHDGGYSATLGPTRLEAEQTLNEMQADRWQDDKTRIIFVELTTFNGNKILFSQTTLVVEYLVSGTILLKARVSSMNSVLDVNLWNILFVVFILAYIVKTIYLISYYGLLEYLLRGVDNLFQIINIVAGISSILLFCAHFYTASQYTNKLKRLGYDEYFEYDFYVRYFVLLQIALLFLFCNSIIRVIGSIQGKSFMVYFSIFTSSLKFLYCMTVLIVIALFVLRLWTHILYITTFSLKELLVNSKSLKYVTTQHIQNACLQIFILFKIFIIYVMNIIFLVVLIHNTRLSKSNVFGVLQRNHFITLTVSRIISWLGKIISRKSLKNIKM